MRGDLWGPESWRTSAENRSPLVNQGRFRVRGMQTRADQHKIFDDCFHALTGNAPLEWQERLFRDHFLNDDIPATLDLPTGLGKTSVMAIWYLAMKAGACLPRRLVYVVDRRAVVDQATTIADEIKNRSGDNALCVSTLRGRHVDNRAWLADPVAPAIIVGTVDMIGSRLLFSGYGVSRKMRPYHAGLLGADTLVVLDESHLVPPFERLLEAIEDGARMFGPREGRTGRWCRVSNSSPFPPRVGCARGKYFALREQTSRTLSSRNAWERRSASP